MKSMEGPDEQRIQEMARRLGMRKTVEAWFESFIILLVLPTMLPAVIGLGSAILLPTTSYWFIFVQAIIFLLRVISQNWMIRFTIDNEEWAERLETGLELAQIALILY